MILSTKPRLLYHKYKTGVGIRIKKYGRTMFLSNKEATLLAWQIAHDNGYKVKANEPEVLKLNG